MNKIFAILLDVIICVSAFLYILFAMLSLKRYYFDTNLIKEYQDNWSRGPIIDIQANAINGRCPEGYEEMITNDFPGMFEGCDCSGSSKLELEVDIFKGKCDADMLLADCRMVFKFDDIPLAKWKGTNLCAKRMQKRFWDLVITDSNCPNGHKKCGLLDNFNNTLCVKNEEMCPINDIFALPSNQTQPENYNRLDLAKEYSLYFTNTHKEAPIIVDIEARSAPPCTHPYEGELGQNNYQLNKKIGHSKCTTEINNSLLDNRFKSIDSESLTELYNENNIMRKIANIPAYPKILPEEIASLYKINYFGWDKKCIKNVAGEKDLKTIQPDPLGVSQVNRICFYLTFTALLNLFFVISSILVYKCFLERMRIPFNSVIIIDCINITFVILIIVLSFVIIFNTNKILRPYGVFIDNKCGDETTNGVMNLAFHDISRVNGLLIWMLIVGFVEIIYITVFHLYTHYTKNRIE
jgi:hypothetical protein